MCRVAAAWFWSHSWSVWTDAGHIDQFRDIGEKRLQQGLLYVQTRTCDRCKMKQFRRAEV